MKIKRIYVWQTDLPLTKPYWLSGGRLKFEQLDSTFIRIETDDNISGWGEACPWGHTYLPAHGHGVRAALQTLAPALIDCDPLALDAINRRMDTTLPGHLYAKSAVDIACWDILGKTTELPLWRLLGSDTAAAVPINSSISTGSAADMLRDIRTASGEGYRVHSAKVGGDIAQTDIVRINAIEDGRQDTDSASESITYDINRAWLPGVAIQVLNSIRARGWIEQPCETIEQCAYVARHVPQPILLDECLHTADDHLTAWRLDACAGIKLKPNRVGGLTKARWLRDFAVAVGWQMHVEDVGGSVLADTVVIHLAASVPPANRLASWLCHAHLAKDMAPGQGARNVGGFATPPTVAGIGVTPDVSLLGEPFVVYE